MDAEIDWETPKMPSVECEVEVKSVRESSTKENVKSGELHLIY